LAGNDVVNGYLLLATSCDGTLATIATPTTVRVVCNNTLSMAVNGTVHPVKVGHRSQFDADAVKRQLGIAVSQWDSFMYQMKTLSERKVKSQEVKRFLSQVFANTDSTPAMARRNRAQGASGSLSQAITGDLKLANERAMNKAMTLFNSQGRGAELQAAKDTAWGLLCAVTEFVDHEKQARSAENRLNSAWFGQGANIKQKALEQAVQLVA
jgi:phage/plasmid-like protein (TIGR03299 family)